MSRIDLKFDEKKKTYYLEGPFRDNLQLPEDDNRDFIPPPIEGWSIPEVSHVFRSWLDHNERNYLRDMEDPKIKVSLKDKEFELQVTDTSTYKVTDTSTYKLRLQEVQKKLDEDDDIDSGVVVSFQKKESE